MRLAALAAILVLAGPARAQEDPTVRQLRAMLPAGNTLTFARARPVTGGPAPGVTLEEVVLLKGTERTTIASLTLVGLRPDGVASITARDLVGVTPTGNVTIANLQATGLAIRRRPDGSPAQPDDVKLSTLLAENFTGPGSPRFAIARISASNWGIGRRSEAEIAGMSFSGFPDNPIQEATIARMALSGFDMASTATSLGARRAPSLPPAGHYTAALEGVVLRAAGATLGGLEAFTMEGDIDAQGSGTSRFAMRGLTVDRAAPTAQFLDAVGLDRLESTLTFDSSYDAATGRLLLPAFALGVRQLGALALALGIDGYTPEAAQRNDISRMRLLSARLRYADQSLYGRVVRSQAQRSGVTEQALRDQFAQLVAGGLASGAPNPAIDALRDVLLRFVRGEINQVELEARPAAPVPFSGLAQGAQLGPVPLLRQLGITATGRQSP